jgi:hypothetical protein
MDIAPFPFQALDWTEIEPVTKPGETGTVTMRVAMLGSVRVRCVEYSPNYLADHWCVKGHVLHVTNGELVTELDDGRSFTLTAGMTYLVGDNSEPHRSRTTSGASLFIVD